MSHTLHLSFFLVIILLWRFKCLDLPSSYIFISRHVTFFDEVFSCKNSSSFHISTHIISLVDSSSSHVLHSPICLPLLGLTPTSMNLVFDRTFATNRWNPQSPQPVLLLSSSIWLDLMTHESTQPDPITYNLTWPLHTRLHPTLFQTYLTLPQPYLTQTHMKQTNLYHPILPPKPPLLLPTHPVVIRTKSRIRKPKVPFSFVTHMESSSWNEEPTSYSKAI